jgi:hypothetical protein
VEEGEEFKDPSYWRDDKGLTEQTFLKGGLCME